MATLFLFLGATAYLTPAQQDASQQPTGDAVADAARKARSEQKVEPKPKKVFTNDDIPSTPAGAPAPATTSQATTKQGAEATGKKEQGKGEGKDENYWRAQFQEIHAKIAQTEQELDVLQRELNKDDVQYYSDPQKALMQQHDRSDINDKTAKINAKKKELDDLNQKLSDMEDELRKSGGDPGWAR
jgi:predicted RNase H-like nuclease (RuvC/YqgF family)